MVTGFGEKDQRGEVPFSSQHINSACCQHDVDLELMAEVVLVRFPHCKVKVTLSPLSTLCSFEEGAHGWPTLNGWRVTLHFLEGGGSTTLIAPLNYIFTQTVTFG